MQIWKLHALGNHFIFVLHEDDTDYPKLAQFLCQRSIAVGADGLLTVNLKTTPPTVRMWNPDGTEDFCGNGMCCATTLIRFIANIDTDSLLTPYGIVPVRAEKIEDSISQVTITIKRPIFDPVAIPLAPQFGQRAGKGFKIKIKGRWFNVIPSSNGNVHTVIFVDEPVPDSIFNTYSPRIETHSLFPYKTNVLWCCIKNEQLHMRIWERSVGETLSCGTGAAAAVAICDFAGLQLPSTVQVMMSGGTALASLRSRDVDISTRATIVFQGSLVGIDKSQFFKPALG
jgi:diaminopimelate epimerase